MALASARGCAGGSGWLAVRFSWARIVVSEVVRIGEALVSGAPLG